MVLIATAGAKGPCDCSPRFGKVGCVTVIDDRRIAYPEFREHGMFASLGNISEDPHIGRPFVSVLDTTVALHVNRKACLFEPDTVPDLLSAVHHAYEIDPSRRLVKP